jgi:hypothetical protein
MKKLFKMSDLGVLHYYLGIEVKKKGWGAHSDTIKLCTENSGEGRHGGAQSLQDTHGAKDEIK